MIRRTAIALSLLAFSPACKGLSPSSGEGGGAAVEVNTEEQKTFYALGYMVGRSLGNFALTPKELEIVKAGLADAATGKTAKADPREYMPKVRQLDQQRSAKRSEGERTAGKAHLEKAAKEPGAEKLASGMVWKSLKAGSGPSPTSSDRVKVHYHGTLINGTVFDSSVQRKEPAEFPLGGVIPCWTEGVQKMKVGEKAQLVCPPELAYGERGSPPVIPGGATLVFEVELLEILKADKPKVEIAPPVSSPPPPASK